MSMLFKWIEEIENTTFCFVERKTEPKELDKYLSENNWYCMSSKFLIVSGKFHMSSESPQIQMCVVSMNPSVTECYSHQGGINNNETLHNLLSVPSAYDHIVRLWWNDHHIDQSLSDVIHDNDKNCELNKWTNVSIWTIVFLIIHPLEDETSAVNSWNLGLDHDL